MWKMWGIVYKLQECSLPPRQFLVFRLWLWQAANVAVPQCLKKWSEAPIILLNLSWKLSASLVDTILENLCNQKQSILMVLDLQRFSGFVLSFMWYGNPLHPLPDGILQQSDPSDVLVQKRSLPQHRRNRAFYRSFHLRSFSVFSRNRTCGF